MERKSTEIRLHAVMQWILLSSVAIWTSCRTLIENRNHLDYVVQFFTLACFLVNVFLILQNARKVVTSSNVIGAIKS